MLKKTLLIFPFILTGCINVYGPVKAGGQADSTQQSATPGMSDVISETKIGNRNPDELFNAIQLFYHQKGISPAVSDLSTGVVAAVGSDEALASLFIDCSLLPQTQNIQEKYRLVTQVWSAGEGSNVSISVSGVAGLTTADGNDKIKPVECKSTGTFEKDLLERLNK